MPTSRWVCGSFSRAARWPLWPRSLPASYTVFIGVLLPAAWMAPFGGLLKNAVLLVAIAIAAAGAERQ
ncbi:MAG TPA: hypothetical protein PLH21_07910 [Chiayiivirga sp.]|nr:hypothetical protein [Chiayiivirga sp.]